MSDLSDKKVKELEIQANEIRQSIISMLVEAGSGHTAGPLGMADIFTALYFHILKHDPKNPAMPERDRLVLSNGHICPVLYATMAHSGYFPVEELKTLRKFGSRLQGHPHREYLPMLENSSGPLGSGLSQAVGMAIADRMDRLNRNQRTSSLEPAFAPVAVGQTTAPSQASVPPRISSDFDSTGERFIYALLSDGEHDEGNTWEAVLLAGKEKLHNLIAIMDRNNIQIDGFTEDIMPLESVRAKYEAFNWHVIEIDGHDMREIVEAVEQAKAIFEKPKMIIAHTIPGCGVPAFERKFEWHGKPPNKEEGEMAIRELRTVGEKLKNS